MGDQDSQFGVFTPFGKKAERAFVPRRTVLDPRSALVALDTNVLLAPYRVSEAVLSEITRIYQSLRDEGRLLVPAQVAREFARNRPTLITGLLKQVQDARALSINGRYSAPPVVYDLPEHRAALAALDSIHARLRDYRTAIDQLAATIGEWERSDPVLEAYSRILDESVVRELSLSKELLEALRKDRYSQNVPPGYKDKDKADGGGGDLAIWLTLLEAASTRARDAILVTEETKQDWFHRAGDDAVFPRYELALEFEEAVPGRTLALMSLSKFLRSFGAAEAAVEEVQGLEVRETWSASFGESDLERRVLSRLESVLGGDVTVSKQQAFPRVGIHLDDGIVGVEVVTWQGEDYRDLTKLIWDAVSVARRGGFVEIALIFVTDSARIASGLSAQFAEENNLGRVSAVVVSMAGDDLRVTANTSVHSLVTRAFPVSRL